MKKKYFILIFLACILSVYGMIPRDCMAAYYFMDDKLRVKGSFYEFMIYRTDLKKEERQYRDKDWGLMKSKATLELLYKAVENEKLEVNLFGFFRYWHDSVPDIDDEYKRSIYRRDRKRYQGPFFDEDDWVNELYADIYCGPWNIRLGKQIVFWSEVSMVRTIDRINPLDLRYTSPGIDPWDEMKLGLWMMRGFYNSKLPGEIVFEWIWIPGDYEQVRSPTEGTSMGNGIIKPEGPKDLRPRPFGPKAAVDRMFHRARPAFNLRNSQFALRMRGSSDVELFGDYYVFDWTVSWAHVMNSTPVARNSTKGYPGISLGAILNPNPQTLNEYMGRLSVARVFGLDLPTVPGHSLWKYRYFDAIGASCQTLIPPLDGVLRGEFAYEIGLPINKTFPKHIQSSGSFITGTSERDQVNAGLTFDRPFLIPLVQDLGGDVIDTGLGCFAQWRLGDVNRRKETFGWGDRSQVNFTLLIKSRFYHSEIRPVISALYNTRNWGYTAFALGYLPTQHMRYEIGFLWMYAGDPTDSAEASQENWDRVWFKIGYEY